MNIGRALKIAVSPLIGTVIFLGIIVAMALIQFLLIDSKSLSQATVYILGYMAFAISLKLVLGAVVGLFIGQADGAPPRGAMLLLALALMASGLFLLMPLLSEYAV